MARCFLKETLFWQQMVYLRPFVAAAIISAAAGGFALRRRQMPGASALGVLMLSVCVWNNGYALELSATGLSTKLFWANAQYAPVVLTPVIWLAFSLEYRKRSKWLTVRRGFMLGIVPLLTNLFVWTNGPARADAREYPCDSGESFLSDRLRWWAVISGVYRLYVCTARRCHSHSCTIPVS
jgi:hypothetical protein